MKRSVTDNSDPIAYIEKLSFRHLQVGLGCEGAGALAWCFGLNGLAWWLLSVGMLAALGSITLRVIEYVAKRRQSPSNQQQSFGRSVSQREMDAVAKETFRLLAQAGYDKTVDVQLEVRSEGGRLFSSSVAATRQPVPLLKEPSRSSARSTASW